MTTEQCACGLPLHYTNRQKQAEVQQLVDDLGERIQVTIGTDTWLVPRHYIALHGLKAQEITELAGRYGFQRVD